MSGRDERPINSSFTTEHRRLYPFLFPFILDSLLVSEGEIRAQGVCVYRYTSHVSLSSYWGAEVKVNYQKEEMCSGIISGTIKLAKVRSWRPVALPSIPSK